MPEDPVAAVSAFIEGAPPGELDDVINDIKALAIDDPGVLAKAKPAFEKYSEEQLTTTKLPGSSGTVLVSKYNSLGDGRYYDTETSTSFVFDHTTQKASAPQSHTADSQHSDLVKSLLKSLSTYATEHYQNATFSVFPTNNDSEIALVVVANKYSPANFWNGRWRTSYLLTPSSGSLEGTLQVDVHYYEDGNVRLNANKSLSLSASANPTASEVLRQISQAEKKYQEELNRGFAALNEGAFKGLRRQLPVTRQKISWERISGYRVGQDIGGGRR